MNNYPKKPRIQCYSIALMCLMLSAPVRADEEGYRTFSDTQGRTFKGQLMDYETASESVVVMCSDGRTGRMPLATFSEADQLFILDWGASRRFQEGLELLPTVKSTPVSEEESGISNFTKDIFDACYEIRFMNTTDAPFEKIKFEYCIFYNQGDRKGRIVHFDEGNCYGAGVVELLNPSSEHVRETKSIRLYSDEGHIGLFGSEVTQIANVHGIWLRLKTKLPSGKEIMREYRTQEDALWEWQPCSFGAGMNASGRSQTLFFTK